MSNIVVWDPRGEFWEGALVDDQVSHILESRGCAVLPVDADHFRSSAIAGYFKRAYGAGWPVGTLLPRIACPMALYVYSHLKHVNFAARVIPESEDLAKKIRGGLKLTGFLRLSSDTSQVLGFGGGIKAADTTAVDFKNIGKLDDYGGWTIKGSAEFSCGSEGVFSCCLYGAAPGVRVAWVAVTQSL